MAAVALLDDGEAGQQHFLTGPEAIGYAQIASWLSAATGRPVEFVNLSDDAARQGMLESGTLDFLADFLVKLFQGLRSGVAARTTDTVARLTGRQPRGFAEFAREHARAFGAAESDAGERALPTGP